jgi:hypothetical protein
LLTLNKYLKLTVALTLILLSALILRLSLLPAQGLWVDEIFSLCVSAGNSLEHHPEKFIPSPGDYQDLDGLVPSSSLAQHAQIPLKGPSLKRILNAVKYSDTSPPLYYILTAGWLHFFGSGDLALRSFSLFFWICSLPVFFLLATRLFDKTTATWSTLLYALAPLSVYYSTEGRMYSLLWFLTLSAGWLTLKINNHPLKIRFWAGWAIVCSLALLTHYFFIFIFLWLASWLKTKLKNNSAPYYWPTLLVLIGLILPWYLHLPEQMFAFKITSQWLAKPTDLTIIFIRLFKQIPLLFTLPLNSNPWSWTFVLPLAGIFFVLFYPAKIEFNKNLSALFFLGGWALAAVLGLAGSDLILKTGLSFEIRYALPALPPVLILTGFLLSRLSFKTAVLSVLPLLISWIFLNHHLSQSPSRLKNPIRLAAQTLEPYLREGDVLIIQSIPSGIVGFCRYLKKDVPVLTWVNQLNNRNPEKHLWPNLKHATRAVTVNLHLLDQPTLAQNQLAARFKPEQSLRVQSISVNIYRLKP